MDHRFDHIFPFVTGEFVDRGLGIGEEPVAKEIEVHHTQNNHRDTNPSKVEHSEGLHIGNNLLIEHHPVDYQVCTGSDKGGASAEDGGIGERDQEFRCVDLVPAAPVPHIGHHDCHEGGVVHEG